MNEDQKHKEDQRGGRKFPVKQQCHFRIGGAEKRKSLAETLSTPATPLLKESATSIYKPSRSALMMQLSAPNLQTWIKTPGHEVLSGGFLESFEL